jgi:exo-beta-1,3-glucanase (GH17 family)
LGKAIFLEWRTKDQINVKVYDQKRTVDYADYRVGLFYISPFELYVEGEAVITKMEKKKSRSMRD